MLGDIKKEELMLVCGIELYGSEARFAVLKGNKQTYEVVNHKVKKMTLNDDANADEVKSLKDTLFTYFDEMSFDQIAIKKRNKKGDYSGGPVGFKIEGIIQLYNNCNVVLISPQRISSFKKKFDLDSSNSLYKYQKTAFETAFSILPE